MIRFALSALFALVLVCLPSSASAQAFNLSLLGLGPHVKPVYIESDEQGPKLVIVWRPVGGIDGGYWLVNPRKPALIFQSGLFCYEEIGSGIANDWTANPNYTVWVNTINVDGKTMIQVYDTDASDGNTPWHLIAPEFKYCK